MLYKEFCSVMNYNEALSYKEYGYFIHDINRCVNVYRTIQCFNCENYINIYKNKIKDDNNAFIAESYSFKKVDDDERERHLFYIKKGYGEYYTYESISNARKEDNIEEKYFERRDSYTHNSYLINEKDANSFNAFITHGRDLCNLNYCDIKKIGNFETYDIAVPETQAEQKFKFREFFNGTRKIIPFKIKKIYIPKKCNLYKKFIYPYPSDVYFSCNHWQYIVQRRKNIDLHKCQVCGKMETRKDSLVIHHLTYERLGYEDIDDVITVCKSCHTAIHKEHQKEKKKKNLENVLEKMKNFKKQD